MARHRDRKFGLFGIATLLAASALAVPGRAAEPVGLIFDTDICSDCDDVLALAMIHALESRGACKLLAVTVSVDHELAAPFVDAVNHFYGRSTVPIGTVGRAGPSEESAYLGLVREHKGGRPRFPHRLRHDTEAPPATGVLRKALAARPDGSVVLVQVGFSTNLARLLDSPPDEHSPLVGAELVRKKVRLLSMMAGAFEPIEGNRRFLEYNVKKDVANCRRLADGWPSPIVWSGFEIGIALPYPGASVLRDFAYAADHPVAAAFLRHTPPPGDRPTWDLTSVLQGVLPDRGYFDLSPPGKVTVETDGFTRFEPVAGGTHRYLKLDPSRRDRVLEALVQLSSQPPTLPATRP